MKAGRTGENRDSSLAGHRQNLSVHQDSEERSYEPTGNKPELPLSGGGPPVEAWVDRSSPQIWGLWQLQARKVPLGVNTLGVHH